MITRIVLEIVHGVNACIILYTATQHAHDHATIVYNLIFFSCAIFITFILGVIPTIVIPGRVSDSFLDLMHKRLMALGWQSKPESWRLPNEMQSGLLSRLMLDRALSNAGLPSIEGAMASSTSTSSKRAQFASAPGAAVSFSHSADIGGISRVNSRQSLQSHQSEASTSGDASCDRSATRDSSSAAISGASTVATSSEREER